MTTATPRLFDTPRLGHSAAGRPARRLCPRPRQGGAPGPGSRRCPGRGARRADGRRSNRTRLAYGPTSTAPGCCACRDWWTATVTVWRRNACPGRAPSCRSISPSCRSRASCSRRPSRRCSTAPDSRPASPGRPAHRRGCLGGVPGDRLPDGRSGRSPPPVPARRPVGGRARRAAGAVGVSLSECWFRMRITLPGRVSTPIAATTSGTSWAPAGSPNRRRSNTSTGSSPSATDGSGYARTR